MDCLLHNDKKLVVFNSLCQMEMKKYNNGVTFDFHGTDKTYGLEILKEYHPVYFDIFERFISSEFSENIAKRTENAMRIAGSIEGEELYILHNDVRIFMFFKAEKPIIVKSIDPEELKPFFKLFTALKRTTNMTVQQKAGIKVPTLSEYGPEVDEEVMAKLRFERAEDKYLYDDKY